LNPIAAEQEPGVKRAFSPRLLCRGHSEAFANFDEKPAAHGLDGDVPTHVSQPPGGFLTGDPWRPV
ncbi:hypothetical protein, partial [Microvirga sp. Mcv34]|uniref:hypothetical protein n=1 Tax=Microvirga sp. Mcv34 TaxID=2926016 RepID=UPI0021C59A02